MQDSGSLSEYIRTYVFVRFSSLCSHREMYSPEPNSVRMSHNGELIMEKGFLDKVEDNVAVQTWFETTQREKGQVDFYSGYGDLPYLFDIKMDKHLFRALAQFWNPVYSCFTFRGVDLVPTVEEYMAL
ncbi:hypothetical protein Goklo_028081, partial [Gossypium klotzschianum]|nr:hypothetical protein [Gossypium klotzschianum]